MTLVKTHEGDYALIAAFLETRLASYFTVGTVDPIPDGQVAERHEHFPYTFGDRFPVGGVSELTHEGETSQGFGPDSIPAPEFIDIGIRVYHPSLTLSDPSALTYEDGRVGARRVTRLVYAAWRKALYADYDLRGQVRHLTVGRVEAGDHDRLGNPFTAEGTDSILWVHAATARFYL